MTNEEQTANDEILKAWHALTKAKFYCEKAGYGSQVIVPLDDAIKQANYAWKTAEGRN